MNDSSEERARGRLKKLAGASLVCSALCIVPSGLLASLGFIGINVLVIFALISYRNRNSYSEAEYLYSDNRYIYRTIFWGTLWVNVLAAAFCSGIVYFIVANFDLFRTLFQEMMSSLPADLLSSIRNNGQLSADDNQQLINTAISVYKSHEAELRNLFFSYSFILFVALPFFLIIVPVIWMIYRSAKALIALGKKKDLYTGMISDGTSGSVTKNFTQEA